MVASTKTENQTAPAGPRAESAGREALVAAHPVSLAIPVPLVGDAVGRDWLEDRGIKDAKASRAHCTFSRVGGRLRMEDLGSTNGTWVDGDRLLKGKPAELREGSVLRIAKTLLVYRKQLHGRDAPSEPLGAMVGPYGLRGVAEDLDALDRRKPTTVLIEGETGTGKELLAAEIARRLGRALTPVNMAAVAATLFESSLFGHVPGAFTDSRKGAQGIFVANNRGAVLLDEIGELPLELQPKLLRLLENREVLPVGATSPIQVDIVILAATNRDLREMVEEGRFRRDLLTRLEQWVVKLPPLHERAEDIVAIVRALLERRGSRLDTQKAEPEALERLMLAPWEGNVRELSNVLDRATAKGEPGVLQLHAVEAVLGPKQPNGLTADAVAKAMEQTRNNKSKAAKLLRVSRPQLLRFLSRQEGGGRAMK